MTGDERRTAQKEAVRRALRQAPGFVSAGELHERLAAGGNAVGLATVYRQLNALAEDGRADTIPGPGGRLFRACEAPGVHHHHLVCEACGRAFELDAPDEAWIRDAATEHRFTVTRHVLEVFGRCADCPTY
ncbi:transcriptional repressor [Microbacterium sp. NPDC096154]|uniref:Fur family transcriptional regulator n=1 Tax=Microbacterium sp. NPDC096154 TaxID=3155549 RepID=UPI003316C0AC